MFEIVLVAFSTLVNIILALLIVLRLVQHQRHIREVLGSEHGSPYSKVTTMGGYFGQNYVTNYHFGKIKVSCGMYGECQ